jgi:hypothetical protein
MCHIRGRIRGEGGVLFKGEGVCQRIEGGNIVIHTPPFVILSFKIID